MTKNDFHIPLIAICKCGHDSSQHCEMDDLHSEPDDEGCTVCDCKIKWNPDWQEDIETFNLVKY